LSVYNPRKLTTGLSIGRKTAKLVQIDALSFGNTYEGRISFEGNYAVLNEEDQNTAHRIGLMFTPAGVLEVTCFKSSDPEMNRDKPRESGLEIYCDNRACQKEIKNPRLVIDQRTGGAYHSPVCYEKDIRLKSYLGVRGCSPKEVSMDQARDMLREGLLQQSPNFGGDSPNLRALELWPEAAVVLPH
jgi:hypothetical protein